MEKIFDLIVLGGGPAGLTACLYARRFGLEVLLIEKLTLGGTINLTDRVDNYPGFPEGISGKELGSLLADHCQSYEAETVYDEVKRVAFENNSYFLEGEFNIYQAKSLIYCTGTKPKTTGIAGEDKFYGRGVSFCAACDAYMFKDKEVAVIGGGDSAVVEAIYLASLSNKVYIIHRRNQLRAVKSLQDKLVKMENISIVWNSIPLKIIGEKEVAGLEIKNVKTEEIAFIPIKGVFIYVGETPQTELIKNLVNLDENGYILTDEFMQTSTPGLFIAGDVRKKPFRQIVTAVSDGAIAAFSAYHYLEEIKK
ncbi:MAG: Thioredoxin reductase [candidate division WS2 bacterium]|uniref:Thioredoxin reductase n=1 Tax=Psychracetigena formicireducens TaxID=2986056 RepID=A0A9E2BFS6_PSYF1|nr:Thioredoxin reductase [Candidatus Psychracetigena formicireducens]MBT9144800.1 Thioredoxin reductase [Candidatus Psychracetigena formicireducens]MBT9149943.1 Thioredoxin reductase [Candidatus Psychracetigena formicireducens]